MTLTITGERPPGKAAPAGMSGWKEPWSHFDAEKRILIMSHGQNNRALDRTPQGLNPSSAIYCVCHLGEVTKSLCH